MSQILDPTALQIVMFPHPTLRHKSKPVRRVDDELRSTVRRMFELMYAARGVGLAANQVDLPLRLFVVNLKADAEEGEELVFINPIISRPKGAEEAEEGCLSLPGLYGQVKRPKQIRVNAYNLEGREIHAELDGMLARVVQHELDHLDGVMFTDRMSTTGRLAVQEILDEFETEFQSRRNVGEIPSDEVIATRLLECERQYCSSPLPPRCEVTGKESHAINFDGDRSLCRADVSVAVELRSRSPCLGDASRPAGTRPTKGPRQPRPRDGSGPRHPDSRASRRQYRRGSKAAGGIPCRRAGRL